MSKTIPFNGPAEKRTVEGWACSKCGMFYGQNERGARYCCATTGYCRQCGSDVGDKYHSLCNGCRSVEERKKFDALESRDYDGSPVVTWGSNQYLYDEDDLADHLIDSDDPDEEMFVFAECRPPRWTRTLSEELADDLPEDCDWDTSEIDEQIAKWVEQNAPKVYWPTKVRVSMESLRKQFADVGIDWREET